MGARFAIFVLTSLRRFFRYDFSNFQLSCEMDVDVSVSFVAGCGYVVGSYVFRFVLSKPRVCVHGYSLTTST